MLPHVHPAESGVRLVRGIVKDVQLNKLIVDNGEEVMVHRSSLPGGRNDRLVDPLRWCLVQESDRPE
jgi:hypothetical protein